MKWRAACRYRLDRLCVSEKSIIALSTRRCGERVVTRECICGRSQDLVVIAVQLVVRSITSFAARSNAGHDTRNDSA